METFAAECLQTAKIDQVGRSLPINSKS